MSDIYECPSCGHMLHRLEREAQRCGGWTVSAPHLPVDYMKVRVIREPDIKDALRATSSYFAGAHVNAGVAVGRVYVELGIER